MKRSYRLRRTRECRPEIIADPAIFEVLAEHRGLHCDEDIVRRQEMERALLMRWVRREMGRRLTRRERQMVELHYLEMMTIEEVARHKRVHFSTVFRSLRRSVGKLRNAAREIAGEQPLRQAVLQAMEEEEG